MARHNEMELWVKKQRKLISKFYLLQLLFLMSYGKLFSYWGEGYKAKIKNSLKLV